MKILNHDRLCNVQVVLLLLYITENEEYIKAENPPYVEFTRRANAELGFLCSETNIRVAAMARDIPWAPESVIKSL